MTIAFELSQSAAMWVTFAIIAVAMLARKL